MKFNLIKSSFFLFTALMVFSCSNEDKTIDLITDNVTRGAVLRQIDVLANSVALNSDTGLLESGEQFAVDLEYQDTEDGALLSVMEVYLAYADNTDDGVDNAQAEQLIDEIPASNFTQGDRGLPTISYAISGDDMLSSLGMSADQLGIGGDQFVVRFEVVLEDGRRFSVDDNTGTLTGNYFRSPFAYGVTVVCAPSVPTSGTWTVNTNDSYGDGWNGASLTITLDGAVAASIANEYGGPNDQQFTFDVPSGTSTISIVYVSGDWDSEVTFNVISANGNTVVNVPTPAPLAGVELLDFCLGGL